jgi:hypothetical protein
VGLNAKDTYALTLHLEKMMIQGLESTGGGH